MLFDFKSYRHGTHPKTHKQRTVNIPIEDAPLCDEYVFPLSMHLGAPATAKVEVGQKVKMGQLIAESAGFISANIHSSISGEVMAIEKRPTLNGLQDCIIIKNDYQDEKYVDESFTNKSFVEKVLASGIVGMGGATFPTNVKLTPPPHNRLDTLIVNGAECEPYVTADTRLMIEKSHEIVEGIKLILQALPSIKQAYIGIESQSKLALNAMKSATKDEPRIEVRTLKTLYPQGAEKTIIKNMTGREVPSGKLPAEVGCLVSNVATVHSIYNAITHQIPSISRVVTINGKPVQNPKNLLTRFGTPISVLLDVCQVKLDDCQKILSGGPMMGKTITDLNIPVIKGTNGLTCLTPQDLKPQEATPCILCSECLNGCPVNLQPILISESAVKGQFDISAQLGAMDCIECGNCTYGCPAKIDLLANIRHAKTNIKAASQAK